MPSVLFFMTGSQQFEKNIIWCIRQVQVCPDTPVANSYWTCYNEERRQQRFHNNCWQTTSSWQRHSGCLRIDCIESRPVTIGAWQRSNLYTGSRCMIWFRWITRWADIGLVEIVDRLFRCISLVYERRSVLRLTLPRTEVLRKWVYLSTASDVVLDNILFYMELYVIDIWMLRDISFKLSILTITSDIHSI